MIEPWHAPILVMGAIIVSEYLLGTTLPKLNRPLAQRLYQRLPKAQRVVIWALLLMLGTAALVALFGSNVASTLVGILAGLTSVFAFLILIHNQRGAGAPSPPHPEQHETSPAGPKHSRTS